LVGYTVHRGAGATNQNDGAAIIWTEGSQIVTGTDGYWKFTSLTQDIDTVSPGSLANLLNVMGASFSVASSPNPVSGSLASSGAFRTQNAVVAVASRNAAGTGNLFLVGTDGYDRITHGGTLNAGYVFNTRPGAIYDFQVNSLSQVQVGQNSITYASTDGYALLTQAPTAVASATGATMTVSAQAATGSLGIGGNLVLSSGHGSLIDGYVELQVDGYQIARVEPNTVLGSGTFSLLQGFRRHVTNLVANGSDGYITPDEELVAITSLTAPTAIHLPAFPVLGDTYEIKDTTGNAATFPVTVSGNGSFIDGYAGSVINQAYAFKIFTWTGSSWSTV
jgi:hypothetical protein